MPVGVVVKGTTTQTATMEAEEADDYVNNKLSLL
jgi:hypothetical protein